MDTKSNYEMHYVEKFMVVLIVTPDWWNQGILSNFVGLCNAVNVLEICDMWCDELWNTHEEGNFIVCFAICTIFQEMEYITRWLICAMGFKCKDVWAGLWCLWYSISFFEFDDLFYTNVQIYNVADWSFLYWSTW